MKVTTGSSLGAGTDANVLIKIIGTKSTTAEHKLEGSGDAFDRGKYDDDNDNEAFTLKTNQHVFRSHYAGGI